MDAGDVGRGDTVSDAVDGRVAAWTSAWQSLETLSKIRSEACQVNDLNGQLPVQYWAILRETEALIEMSKVDTGVGWLAGSWLSARWEEQITTQSARTTAMFEETMKRYEQPKDDDVNPEL